MNIGKIFFLVIIFLGVFLEIQQLNEGEPFFYRFYQENFINASYFVNDTRFRVSASGLVRNNAVLGEEYYCLEVKAENSTYVVEETIEVYVNKFPLAPRWTDTPLMNRNGEYCGAEIEFFAEDNEVPQSKKILVVDRDYNSPDVHESTYAKTLKDALGYEFVRTSIHPSQYQMDQYKVIVFHGGFAGYPYGSFQTRLIKWFNSTDKCLFISAQQLLNYYGDDAEFPKVYLGANNGSTIDDAGDMKDVVGNSVFTGLEFQLNYTQFEEYYGTVDIGDIIKPVFASEAAFTGDLGTVSVFREAQQYKSLFFSTSFAAIDPFSTKVEILRTFMDVCGVKPKYSFPKNISYAVDDTVNFSIDENGVLRNNSFLPYGSVYTVNVTTRSGDLVQYQVVNVTIVDSAPVWNEVPTDQDYDNCKPLAYDISATDFCHFNYFVNDSRFIVDKNGTLRNDSFIPNGKYPLIVGLRDIRNEVTEEITITVKNHPPFWINKPMSQVVDFCEGVKIAVKLGDVGCEMLMFEVDNDDFFIDSEEGYLFNGTFLEQGSYNLSINVTDGYHVVSQEIILTDPTYYPSTEGLPETLTYVEYNWLNFTLESGSASCRENTYSVINTTDFRIVNGKRLQNNTALEVGVYHLTIDVSDGLNNARHKIVVNVRTPQLVWTKKATGFRYTDCNDMGLDAVVEARTTNVLLVDQYGYSTSVQEIFKEPLRNLSIPFEIFNTIAGFPSYNDFNMYDIIIYYSHDEYHGLYLENEIELGNWLDQKGKCFWISSADYIYAQNAMGYDIPTEFMSKFLGMSSKFTSDYFNDDVETLHIQGKNIFNEHPLIHLDFHTEERYIENWIDEIVPLNPDNVAFDLPPLYGNKSVGIFKDGDTYRTLFTAFPFGAIKNTSMRKNVMEEFFEYCDGVAKEGTEQFPVTYSMNSTHGYMEDSTWISFNNPGYFSIDSNTGRITNTTVLPFGYHDIIIYASDGFYEINHIIQIEKMKCTNGVCNQSECQCFTASDGSQLWNNYPPDCSR